MQLCRRKTSFNPQFRIRTQSSSLIKKFYRATNMNSFYTVFKTLNQLTGLHFQMNHVLNGLKNS